MINNSRKLIVSYKKYISRYFVKLHTADIVAIKYM